MGLSNNNRILNELNTQSLKESLASYPLRILEAKANVRAAHARFRDAEEGRALREAELTADIAAEVNRETGKPAFSNDGARKAELMKRMSIDAEYATALSKCRKAEEAHCAAQDQLEMWTETFKAARFIARITAAELELLASDDAECGELHDNSKELY